MGEPKTAVAPVDGRHYRELAEKLRKIARQSRSAGARQKILVSAARRSRSSVLAVTADPHRRDRVRAGSRGYYPRARDEEHSGC